MLLALVYPFGFDPVMPSEMKLMKMKAGKKVSLVSRWNNWWEQLPEEYSFSEKVAG